MAGLDNKENRVIVIVGPTSSGKSKLALMLAKLLETEIISADSRQVYKYLDIGTAKVEKEDLLKVKHHFIDTLEPIENFNVSDFEEQSLQIINELHSQNKIPIVAGGSGLYIKGLINGITTSIFSNPELREELIKQREEKGNDFLYERLSFEDPQAADTMLPQNWKRVIRALEVKLITGKSILEHHKEFNRSLNINFLQFGLRWDREILYSIINNRVDDMIKNGLVDEVKSILRKDYSPLLNSLNTVGYKEIIQYLHNEHSLEKAIELIKRNTRRYAKKQITWFNADEQITWLSISSFEEMSILAQKIITLIN